MSKIKKTKELLSYINNPLSKDSIDVLYNANNVKHERCTLYGDFIQSLMLTVFDTYMGDAFTNQENRVKHFKWCWDKTINDFKNEGIEFNSSKELYEYFLGFTSEVYYSLENKDGNLNVSKNILKLWSSLFGYNTVKSRSDVDTFIEVYALFDKTLKK